MAEVNDIYKVRMLCTVGNQIGLCVFHYKCTGKAGTGASDVTIATGWDGVFAAPAKTLMSSQATYRGVGVQKIFPLPVGVESAVAVNAGLGTVVSDLLPKQIAGLFSFYSGLAGRKQRGRHYMPFPAESDNQIGATPSAGYVTNLDAMALAVQTIRTWGGGGNTNSFALVLWHRVTFTSDLVVARIARTVWATQRRRGDYGRPNLPPF